MAFVAKVPSVAKVSIVAIVATVAKVSFVPLARLPDEQHHVSGRLRRVGPDDRGVGDDAAIVLHAQASRPGADSVRRAGRTAPAQKKRRPGGPGRRDAKRWRAAYSPADGVRLAPILKNIAPGAFASLGNDSVTSSPSVVQANGSPTTSASEVQSAGSSEAEPCSV